MTHSPLSPSKVHPCTPASIPPSKLRKTHHSDESSKHGHIVARCGYSGPHMVGALQAALRSHAPLRQRRAAVRAAIQQRHWLLACQCDRQAPRAITEVLACSRCMLKSSESDQNFLVHALCMPSTCMWSPGISDSATNLMICYETLQPRAAHALWRPATGLWLKPDGWRTWAPQHNNGLIKQPHALRLALRHIPREVHLQRA